MSSLGQTCPHWDAVSWCLESSESAGRRLSATVDDGAESFRKTGFPVGLRPNLRLLVAGRS